MPTTNKYLNYSEKQLICDEYFQEWILRPDEEKDRFWKEFLDENPEKKSDVENAIRILRQVDFAEHFPENERAKESLSKALLLIDETDELPEKRGGLYKKISTALSIAAIFITVVGLALTYRYYQKNVTTQLQTPFGKMEKIILPDSSLVVLNGNSNISFRKHWFKDKPREIWLKGEGFFDVKHIGTQDEQKPYSRFLVHTEELTIEVLGTSFDVRLRRNKTEIVLKTGKIKLTFKHKGQPALFMSEGEIVKFDNVSKTLTATRTDAESYMAWVEKKLVITNGSFKDIIEYIEDNYGKEVILKDRSLLTRKIEGSIILDDFNDVLFVLSKVLDVDIVQQESTLIFTPKH